MKSNALKVELQEVNLLTLNYFILTKSLKQKT